MRRELVVTPRTWTTRGEAMCVVRGHPVHVWQGIVGESAKVRVVRPGQNRDYAVFRATNHPSPDRVEPICDRYHTCGGCPLMHLTPDAQRDVRRELVVEALAEEGFDEVPVGQVVPSPDGDTDYRHIVKLGVGWSDHGRLRVGAWGRHTRTIVPIPHCHAASPALRKAMTAVAHHILDLDIRPYDPQTDSGVIRSVVLRSSRTTGDVLVTLVAGRRVRILNDLATALTTDASEIVGVALHLNDDPGNAIYDRDEEGRVPWLPLEGQPWIEEKLGAITYKVGPGDFFQTNPGMAERIYADVIDGLRLEPEVPVVDLYSGVGGMALQAAGITGWAIGVEEIAGAAEQARTTARAHDIDAEFLAARVDEGLTQVGRRLVGRHPAVVVNPARRGLEPGVAEGLAALKPRRVAYVSCNPRALARDLVELTGLGFRLDHLDLYDMFPNTPHVEAVAWLEGFEPEGPPRRAPRRRVVGKVGRKGR